jgi:hypothetical protein
MKYVDRDENFHGIAFCYFLNKHCGLCVAFVICCLQTVDINFCVIYHEINCSKFS